MSGSARPYIPYLKRRGLHYGVDLNALARKACESLAAKDAARKRALESGVREHQWDVADSLVVAQEAADPHPHDPLRIPRTRWRTITMPHGLSALTVFGSLPEATANGWTLHELLTRRLHRAYCDALIAAKVCDVQTAKRRARETKVHVADVGLST